MWVRKMEFISSYDCGIHYEVEAVDEFDKLMTRGKELDREGIRWVIKDGDKILAYSHVHLTHAQMILNSGACLLTVDRYMQQLLNDAVTALKQNQ